PPSVIGHQRRAAQRLGGGVDQLRVGQPGTERVDEGVELLVGVALVGVDHGDGQVERLDGDVVVEPVRVDPVEVARRVGEGIADVGDEGADDGVEGSGSHGGGGYR